MAGLNKDISILVVDDSPLVLNLVGRLLTKLEYTNVSTANDGSVALGKLEMVDQQIDLIICDLNMPEIDGIEFMRLANENGFKGALILLSGEDRRILDAAMDLAKAHKINILSALQKPLRPNELVPLLEQFSPGNTKKSTSPQKPITREMLLSGIKGSDASGLTLYFQPKISVQTLEVSGVESLARWEHPLRGILEPLSFIPLAEESGLINSLTFAVYRKAVQHIAQWYVDGIHIPVSVNFSINTFLLDRFSDFLMDTADEFGVNPRQVMIEVTESQVMENAMNCMEVLTRLRLRKFGLSIDDFGTGNSSMVQLKKIPFNELKIDRAFVSGAWKDASARAIMEASIDLAKKLDMKTVAEGVETREDWDLCETLGVDYVQGFYCARPMPNDELMGFVRNWQGPH